MTQKGAAQGSLRGQRQRRRRDWEHLREDQHGQQRKTGKRLHLGLPATATTRNHLYTVHRGKSSLEQRQASAKEEGQGLLGATKGMRPWGVSQLRPAESMAGFKQLRILQGGGQGNGELRRQVWESTETQGDREGTTAGLCDQLDTVLVPR